MDARQIRLCLERQVHDLRTQVAAHDARALELTESNKSAKRELSVAFEEINMLRLRCSAIEALRYQHKSEFDESILRLQTDLEVTGIQSEGASTEGSALSSEDGEISPREDENPEPVSPILSKDDQAIEPP
eukprot:812896_1